MGTTTKSVRSLSNRELWTALWFERRQRTNGSRLDELHAEWWQRIESLRGRPRRKGWSARGLQRAELFRRATESYFDGLDDAFARMETTMLSAEGLSAEGLRAEDLSAEGLRAEGLRAEDLRVPAEEQSEAGSMHAALLDGAITAARNGERLPVATQDCA